MPDKIDFADEDFAVIDQCRHRLHRIRDYSTPNEIQYFGTPWVNDTAREYLASLKNKMINYSRDQTQQPFIREESLHYILYFLKESDRHLAAAEKEAGGSQRYPMLYERFVELLKKMGIEAPNEVKVPTDDGSAEREMQRFKDYYTPVLDGHIFRDNKPVSGTINVETTGMENQRISLPHSLEAITFDDARLTQMLWHENPGPLIDFTPSAQLLINAVCPSILGIDAKIVETAFAKPRTKFTAQPFGLEWPTKNSWRELSLDAQKYINQIWEEVVTSVKKAKQSFDTPDDFIKFLNNKEYQQKFVAKSIQIVDEKRRLDPPQHSLG